MIPLIGCSHRAGTTRVLSPAVGLIVNVVELGGLHGSADQIRCDFVLAFMLSALHVFL